MAGVPHSNETPARRAGRMAFGVTIAFVISQMANWPIAFIFPVVVIGMLMEAAPFSFRQGWRVFGTGVFFFFVAGTIAWLLSPWPVIMVAVLTVMFYFMSRWLLAQHGPLLDFVSALIGFIVVPIATVLLPDLGMIAALAFSLNWGLGLIVGSTAWLVIPLNAAPPHDDHHGEMDEATLKQLALMLTLVSMPLLIAFFAFSWTRILVAVYAVLFALMFSSSDARSESLKYLTANVTYAGIGMFVCYELMVRVPSLWFMAPMIALAIFIYAYNIFKDGPTSAFWNSGIFGFTIMLGGMLVKSNVDPGGTLFLRLWQMALGGLYVVVAFMIFEYLASLFTKSTETEPEAPEPKISDTHLEPDLTRPKEQT